MIHPLGQKTQLLGSHSLFFLFLPLPSSASSFGSTSKIASEQVPFHPSLHTTLVLTAIIHPGSLLTRENQKLPHIYDCNALVLLELLGVINILLLLMTVKPSILAFIVSFYQNPL